MSEESVFIIMLMFSILIPMFLVSCECCIAYEDVCYRSEPAGVFGTIKKIETPCEHNLWDEKISECALWGNRCW